MRKFDRTSSGYTRGRGTDVYRADYEQIKVSAQLIARTELLFGRAETGKCAGQVASSGNAMLVS